jgi:3-methyladenine DNA glycosylase AlkD
VIDLNERARWADRALRDLADPQRRKATSGYFPTAMEILGVSAPKMRAVLRRLLEDLDGRPPEEVLELAGLLREKGTHEARQVAFELFDRRPDARSLLTARDVRRLGDGNDNWASVAWRAGQLADREISRWARSRDPWWRRTALVCTVPLNMKSRGGTGDPHRTLMICRELVTDREPMVAKGMSWALRALAAVDPGRVRRFVEEYEKDLPALVKREVRNKLDTGRKTPKRRSGPTENTGRRT